MAKFQLHLPRTVRVAVPVSRRDSAPLPVRLVEEQPPVTEVPPAPEAACVPSAEEERLRHQVEQLERELVGLAKQVDRKLEELAQTEAARVGEYRQLAVRLAMIVARSVLREVNAATDQRLEQLIAEGLTQIPGREEVTVRLNPAICDRIAYHFESAGLQRPIRFLPDAAIPQGEVQLDHPLFSLASNLSEQLEQLEQALVEELEH
jgi:flagellar biosynthesis/type III secretory pathway protein FliH